MDITSVVITPTDYTIGKAQQVIEILQNNGQKIFPFTYFGRCSKFQYSTFGVTPFDNYWVGRSPDATKTQMTLTEFITTFGSPIDYI